MSDPRALLAARGLSAKKSFGQNFLLDQEVLASIAVACVPDDERGRADVVELGAGTGALTRLLAARAKRVSAVERDRDLVPLLEEDLRGDILEGRLAVVEADAKTVDLAMLFEPRDATVPRVLCGNLPYQLTGPLLTRATAEADLIDRAVFLIQREVADRLTASPGSKTYGALTVFTQAAFTAKRLRLVGPHAFHPAPSVTSAVVVLTPRRPRVADESPLFRDLVKAAFGARRKTLKNAWGRLGPHVLAAATASGISLDARGETLSVDDFARLERALR